MPVAPTGVKNSVADLGNAVLSDRKTGREFRAVSEKIATRFCADNRHITRWFI